ncbi:MAG: hypothetical protein IIA19_01550 [Thaumarchaeota archaeon]|nr:hypothetical protein [Nitrososphaerota archaeon]
MAEFISSGNKRTFEDFKKQIPQPVVPLFILIRDYCLSIGEKVVEDVRMHRIVFGKSLSFRWFADLEPSSEGIFVKVQKNRKEQPVIIFIKLNQNIEDLKLILKEAYTIIH